jgi:hypothetical protein
VGLGVMRPPHVMHLPVMCCWLALLRLQLQSADVPWLAGAVRLAGRGAGGEGGAGEQRAVV